ncbi:ECF transporter S component [Guptibacillus hwajinpoensis]|uniref:Membrane protein n=1 Tax=Guptibacillus hwajinpoensis TaxID=208199 RepID=A0A0J6FQX9_9BACL|nr:ECF transporter S component [Alkalihalobacillus macyae]KMM36722.1 membrane protein [Alkalihalobacillus macyae]
MNGKRASILAIFIALSVIGAFIKIPAIVGSVALDVFPALVAAVLLGSRSGALIASFGHLLSALLVGLPLGPLHLLIAAEMAALVWLFGNLYKNNKRKLATVSFLVGNAFVAPLPFLFILGSGFYVALVPVLVVGSLLNLGLGIVLIPRLAMIVEKKGVVNS